MKKRQINQGDIYVCDLNDSIGNEQSGDRPCIIISLDILNKTSNNVIIVPITSRHKKDLPTHFKIEKNKYNFLICNENIVLCENLRSISKMRLKKFIGNIDEQDLKDIISLISFCFEKIGG